MRRELCKPAVESKSGDINALSESPHTGWAESVKKVKKLLVDKMQFPGVRVDTGKPREIVCKVERFKDRSAVLGKGLNFFFSTKDQKCIVLFLFVLH